jgi:DNA polymerase phi
VLLELCASVDDAALAALVEGEGAPLAPWLAAAPEAATPESLLLALHLWPRLPPRTAAACPLLPRGAAPPADFFASPAAAAGSAPAAAAAAALFSRQHLAALLPALRATTAAHPRLHSVWPTLLALLMPGFSADKVLSLGCAAQLAIACPAATPLPPPPVPPRPAAFVLLLSPSAV